MPTTIREKNMKVTENFTENTQSRDARYMPLFTQAFLPENFAESAQPHYAEGEGDRVLGETRHATNRTAVQVDVPRDDAIDDIPFVLSLYLKMHLRWASHRTMP